MATLISRPVALRSLAQVVAFSSAMVMAIFVQLQWYIIVGMLAVSVEAVWVTICGRGSVRSIVVGSVSTLFVWGVVLSQLELFYSFEEYYLIIVWLIALGILTAGQRIPEFTRPVAWRVIGLTWLLQGSCVWLFGAYVVNRSLAFHLAVLGTLAGLIACKHVFRLSGPAIQLVNTFILLLIVLPLTDALLRPSYRLDTRPETGKHHYSYNAAKSDPVAFARWWSYFVQQWETLHRAIAIRDPQHITPYIFRPNSRGNIFESEVAINSLGFRGPEIDLAKGDAYRIVALGESTTFGCTLSENETPWPPLLERMLRDRLKPGRPVQVINAGVYGLTIWNNLDRFTRRILPLDPDMIISYHGYNGFSSLDTPEPLSHAEVPPLYIPRPLKLFADAEYRLKLMLFKRSLTADTRLEEAPLETPMESTYARAYEKLIQIAQTNGIRLVLANFSMAVNSRSKLDVIEFYRGGFPKVHNDIQANRLHSKLTARLAVENPGVRFVDTHPGLDGSHEKFIDLVHFTQEGRQQLAETFFGAIREVVAEDLTRPAPERLN